MLMPKRVKFRKQHRGRRKGKAMRGATVDFGDYGLVTLEAAWITARQIEAARIAMTRHIRRGGNVWIRIFPDKPYTKKPLETRMGKGKGPVEGWVAVVKPGRVMFEMDGVAPEVAKEAMRLAMHKLPVKCKFVIREGFTMTAEKVAEIAARAKAGEVAMAAEDAGTTVAAMEASEAETTVDTAAEQAPESAPEGEE